MVGLSGTLGARDDLPPDLADAIGWRDGEVAQSFADDGVDLAFSFHPLLAGDEPAEAADGDVLIWVWGDVYGVGSDGDYEARDGPPGGSARYCAELYDEHGIDFVGELNGDFALVVYDRAAGTVAFVTDRVATRPIYYARPDEESLVVSSNLQALARHPGVDARLQVPYLYEYLQLRRVFGVETPIEGVRELPPASVVTVDLADATTTTETYWRPTYDPLDAPFEDYLEEFIETFEEVMDDWTRDDLDYGILLSGGSDSRLVQAAMDRPATAFHIADWMSREAQVASQAARVSGDEFHLLKRDADYEERALEHNPQLSAFSGWFDQAYFTGFEDEIVEEVDVLVSGLYADMLFGGNPLSTYTLSLGSVGTVSLPFRDPVTSTDDYVEMQVCEAVEPLTYLSESLDIREVLGANIEADGDGIVSHGVRYESLDDLVMYGDFYPMGADTDANFSRSLMQMLPYRTPFLDNRLLDLHRRIPPRYFLRRNFVNQAVDRLAPELAAIPHARTGVPLNRSFAVDFLGGNLKGFWRKHVHEKSPPEAHLDHTPWPDRRALLRATDFPIETIIEHEGLLRDLPFTDYEGALECYRAHLRGQDTSTVLYSLLTFLEMPLTEEIREIALDDLEEASG
jgi:asparagine synthase (glutamine-hydrolysing)